MYYVLGCCLVFVIKFLTSFKLSLPILWHVIEAAVRGGCRHHYCSSYTGAQECTGTREICPQLVLVDTSTLLEDYGPRHVQRASAAPVTPHRPLAGIFRRYVFTVIFHFVKYISRPVLLQSEKLMKSSSCLTEKFESKIKLSNHGAISRDSFSKFTLQGKLMDAPSIVAIVENQSQPSLASLHLSQRPQQRRLYRRIYKTDFKFWAGLGSWPTVRAAVT